MIPPKIQKLSLESDTKVSTTFRPLCCLLIRTRDARFGLLSFSLLIWLCVGQAVCVRGREITRRVAGHTLSEWAEQLSAENETIRLRAAKTMGVFGAAATPALSQMLLHDDASVRYWAASHLGDIGPQANAAKPNLQQLLGDDSPAVRMAAAYALCRTEGVDSRIDVLVEALRHPERGMGCCAAEMLGRIGPPARPALPAMQAAFQWHDDRQNSGDYHVRCATQNAIRKIEADKTLIEHRRPKTRGNYRRRPNPSDEARPDVGTVSGNRLNILYISCEDISPNLGCYGDKYASTPNLDQLAREGARFTQAFTPAGVCAVVRSGIITGMYPISIGSQHMRSRIVPPVGVKCFSEYLRQAGYFCTNKLKTDYQFEPPLTAWDRQGSEHHDWRDRADRQPFFSVINLTVSHESQIRHSETVHAQVLANLRPEQRHDLHRAAEFLPPIYPNTPEARKDWAWYQDNISEMDRQVGEILGRLDEDGLADDTVVIFWSDHGRGLPRGKRWIYESGVHIPMIIRWPGEIEPGTVRDDLVSTQDLPPTTMSIAGLKPKSYMHGRVIVGSEVGPAPEFLFFHRDRMDEAYDLMRGCRDKRLKYIRNYEPEKPYAQHIDYMDRMPTLVDLRRLNADGKLNDAQKVFFQTSKPVEELYDIVTDPHEIDNLANMPEYEQQLAKMRREVNHWQERIGDMGLLPEPIMMQRMRPGARYQTTAKPDIRVETDGVADRAAVSISCRTDGASIAYTFGAYAIGDKPGPDAAWKLYAGTLSVAPGVKITAKACRPGYLDSPAVTSTIP